MPALPSGRHVVVGYSPQLRSWIKTVGMKHVHQYLCLEKPEHVYPWLEVMYLVPDEEGMPASNERIDTTRGANLPVRHHSVNSGFTLGQWTALTKDWEEEDKVAMRTWVETEVRRYKIDNLLKRITDSEEKR